MSSNWTAHNSGEDQYNIPVQLTITKFIMFGNFFVSTTTVYNYFDFRNEKPDIFEFGVEKCFDGIDVNHLMMTFPLVIPEMITDRHEFKYQFSKKVSDLTYLIPTRVDQVQLDFIDGEAVVIFKLLEKSSILGNVENPVEQMSLKDAYTLLEKKVDNWDFKLNINNEVSIGKDANFIRIIE